MRIKPQIDRTKIVLLGSFNHAVFQPAWFARHDMIGDEEAENADVSMSGQESRFKTALFEIFVRRDSFLVAGLDNHSEHVRDLVVSCFGELLPHTPVRAVQISRQVHFDAGSFEVRDRVGSRLAPKEAWGEWGKQIEEASRKSRDRSEHGGMSSIVMAQKLKSEEGRGIRLVARVGPSAGIDGNKGILVDVGNLFNPAEKKAVQDASFAVGILRDCWESSLERAEFIFDQIMKLTEECAE